MSFFGFIFIISVATAIGFIIFLLLRLSKEIDIEKRIIIKKLMIRTVAGLFIIISLVAIFIMPEPISSEARSQAEMRKTENYALYQSIFEYHEEVFELTLNFKGAPVINVVEWDITSFPPEVFFASINKVKGHGVLSFAGIPPRTSYTFYITATVMEADIPFISIPLSINIYNGTTYH